MNNLEQFFVCVGGNAKEVVGRLGGDPGLVIHFLSKFEKDGSFQSLCDALNNDDGETAFRAAHTMKGLCATLGLQNLFEKSSAITEMLRGGGAIQPAKDAMPALKKEYDSTIEALKRLNG